MGDETTSEDDIEHDASDAELAAFKARMKATRDAMEVEDIPAHADGDVPHRVVSDLLGKANSGPFLGKLPGTVVFSMGDWDRHAEGPKWTYLFRHRRTPWNEVLNPDGDFVEYRDARGETLYPKGDFGPLHATPDST